MTSPKATRSLSRLKMFLRWMVTITVFYRVWCAFKYSAHLNFKMIFGRKKLFFKNNFTRINHCKLIHHRSHLKPFLSYLPCILLREYFSIIFRVKKCILYLIKYSNKTWNFQSIAIIVNSFNAKNIQCSLTFLFLCFKDFFPFLNVF